MASIGEPIFNSNYLHVDFSADHHVNSHSDHSGIMPDQTQTITTTFDGTNNLVFKPSTIFVNNTNTLTVSDNTFNSNTFNSNPVYLTDSLDGTKKSPSCNFCDGGFGYFSVGEKTICGVCISRESLESTQLLGLIGDLLLLVTSDRDDEDLLEEARDALRKVDIREHIKRAVA